MKRSRRVLAVLLTLCLVFSLLPTAQALEQSNGTELYALHGLTLTTPYSDEAQVQFTAEDGCTLVIALYDRSGQMLGADMLAVAGSPEKQELSVPIPASRPESYLLKAFLLDSLSLVPLCASATLDSEDVGAAGYDYEITSLTVDGSTVTATVSTRHACILSVELLDETDDVVLGSASTEVDGKLEITDVTLSHSVSLPEYFRARAVLTDEEGIELCKPYTTICYTQAYKTFAARSPEDFPDNVVLDFGTSGYGVLVDGAVLTEGIATETDKGYLLPVSAMPQAGDVLVLTDSNSVQTPVKAASVTDNGDGTVTVVPADASVSELYKVLRLNTLVDVGNAAQNNGEAVMLAEAGEATLVELSSSLTAGALKVSAKTTVSLVADAIYDVELFGEDYFETKIQLKTNGKAEASLSGKLKSSDILKDAFGNTVEPEILIYDGPISVIGLGLASIDIKVSIPLEFEFEAKGAFSLEYANQAGFKYDPVNGCRPIRSNEANAAFELEGKFEIKAGPEIELDLVILRGMLEGGLSGQVGLKAAGVVSHSEELESGDKKHACDACCDISLSLFANITGDLGYDISEKTKGTLLAINLLSNSIDLGKAYCSIINDKDSIFEGKLSFGLGTCPNDQYRVTFNTLSSTGKTLTGIPLSVYSGGLLKGSGTSSCQIYLYDGDYTVKADFDSDTYEKEFTVSGAARTVTAYEGTMDLLGVVTDAQTGEPVQGALVRATPDEGSVRTAYSDSGGSWSLTELAPETWSISISAEGYADWETTLIGEVGAHTLEAKLKERDDYMEWSFDETTGLLSVWGKGEMPYYSSSSGPWREHKEDILKVEVRGLSSICSSAFREHVNLSEVSLPEGLTEIGSYAFYGCSVLTEITLPDGLKTIDDSAFSRCLALEEISLPESLTYIGEYAFNGCVSLRGVDIPYGVEQIYSYTFAYCESMKYLTIPYSVTYISEKAFASCSSLSELAIPGSVTTVGPYAFENCTGLITLTLGEGVKSIYSDAFSGCEKLRSLVLPEGLQSIGWSAFGYCSSLESLTIPDSVTSIQAYAFEHCTALSSVELSSGLSSLSQNMFSGCTNLLSVTFPASITSISRWVFHNCESLSSVYYSGTQEQWNAISVGDYNSALSSATVYYNS